MKNLIKRIITVFLSAVLIVALAGCGGQGTESSGKISIVTTVYPLYDWIKNVAGENADNIEITMLLDTGVDLHSYQPTAQDIIKIVNCDIFVYVGGESDKWVDDALKSTQNKDMITVNLMDEIADRKLVEEEKEGMQSEEEEEEEEGETEYDEHIWLSLKNAAVCVDAIKNALIKADFEATEKYENNAKEYTKKINELDEKYISATENATVKTLVFADRFPFAYLFNDYGLDYYAAFKGCSAETEASFETVIFLAGKVDELGLKSIMRIESSDGSIARTVKENTRTKDQTIVSMDSLQSAFDGKADNAKDYLAVMTDNLAVLEIALK